MKKLIAGNWKMNGTEASAVSLIEAVGAEIAAMPEILERCDFVVCPPALHIHAVKNKIDYGRFPVAIGGQDCSAASSGAFTGDIAAAMLADAGCGYVILGHSERRQNHNESSLSVRMKTEQAVACGLRAIVCVGETDAERAGKREKDVVGRQLADSLPAGVKAADVVIAYEPVWAIGTGKTATPDDVRLMHAYIRQSLKEIVADSANIRILYGGSVKPDNAAALLSTDNVDGALVGGASLSAAQFLGIAKAA